MIVIPNSFIDPNWENPVEHEHRHYPAPAAQDTSYLPWSITNAQDRTLFLKLTLKRFLH